MIQGQSMESVKNANNVAVFKTIMERALISRAELSHATGLTRTTISNVVSRLISLNLVQEVGKGRAGRSGGRRPILLECVSDSLICVGVDIRREKITVLATDMSLRILGSRSRRIPEGVSAEQGLAVLFECIDEVIAPLPFEDIIGIGIGTIGPVDIKSGSVVTCIPIPWVGFSLRDVVSERYHGIPVYVDVGSNMAAYGEVSTDLSLAAKTVTYITLGSGIGAGIVLSGTLYQADLVKGFGHMSIDYRGPECECGNRGCLELYTSATAIVKRYADTRTQPSMGGSPECGTLEEIISTAREGNPCALQTLLETAQILATAIEGLCNLIGPDVIIIGGSISGIGEAFAPLIGSILMNGQARRAKSQISVIPARLLDKSIALGAASFCLGMLLDGGGDFERSVTGGSRMRRGAPNSYL